MAPIQIVLFDLGDTLIHFNGTWMEVFPLASAAMFKNLSAAGLDLKQEDFTYQFNVLMNEYFRQRETDFIEYTTTYILQEVLKGLGYMDVPGTVVRGALDALYAVTQQRWHREEDTMPTLETLQAQGYRLGLISNAGDDLDVQTLVDNAEIRPYFDVILTSAALGIRKPNPFIFQEALEHWGANGSQAVMVGDTLGADILGAHNAGIFSIWITRRADTPSNRAHADTIQPDATIETLGELPPLLDRL